MIDCSAVGLSCIAMPSALQRLEMRQCDQIDLGSFLPSLQHLTSLTWEGPLISSIPSTITYMSSLIELRWLDSVISHLLEHATCLTSLILLELSVRGGSFTLHTSLLHQLSGLRSLEL